MQILHKQSRRNNSIMQIFVCVFLSFFTRFVVRIGDGVEFFASRVARKNPIRELFLGLLKGGEFDGRAGRLVSSTVLRNGPAMEGCDGVPSCRFLSAFCIAIASFYVSVF